MVGWTKNNFSMSPLGLDALHGALRRIAAGSRLGDQPRGRRLRHRHSPVFPVSLTKRRKERRRLAVSLILLSQHLGPDRGFRVPAATPNKRIVPSPCGLL